MSVDWTGISARVREVMRLEEFGIERASARLSLDQQLLQSGVDGVSRSATMKVVEALVRVYGLDPTWIVTGKYDPATHRVAMQAKGEELTAILKRLVSENAREQEPRVE
jgi:hypothetical protein